MGHRYGHESDDSSPILTRTNPSRIPVCRRTAVKTCRCGALDHVINPWVCVGNAFAQSEPCQTHEKVLVRPVEFLHGGARVGDYRPGEAHGAGSSRGPGGVRVAAE